MIPNPKIMIAGALDVFRWLVASAFAILPWSRVSPGLSLQAPAGCIAVGPVVCAHIQAYEIEEWALEFRQCSFRRAARDLPGMHRSGSSASRRS
jgi:hypothetical protein